jgi:hypothetical protein
MVEQQSASALCTVCGAEFPSEDLLNDHRDMHANRCAVCGSEFTTEALLAGHQRLHSSESADEDASLLEEQGERKP